MHQQAIDKPNASPRHPDAQAGFARQLDQRITHHLSQLAPGPARLVEAARDAMSLHFENVRNRFLGWFSKG